MLRDNPEGYSSRWLSSAGGPSPALHVDGRKSPDDRPSCLENPRPAGAESTVTENASSPFQAEPRQPHEQKPEPALKPGQRPAHRGCRYSQFLCSPAQTAALSGKCEHSDVIKIEQSVHGFSLNKFASRARQFRAKVYSILKSADVKCQT